MPDKKVHLYFLPNDKFRTQPNLEFADNHFKYDEDGGKLSKWVENTVGKKRNCLLHAISPFPRVF